MVASRFWVFLYLDKAWAGIEKVFWMDNDWIPLV